MPFGREEEFFQKNWTMLSSYWWGQRGGFSFGQKKKKKKVYIDHNQL